MGISSLGVGTGGIDTASMLEQLKASEQTRLNPYTNLQKSYQAKISSWGLISNSLSALQKNVKSLSSDAFNSLSVSDNKAFNAVASSGALADIHQVQVKTLASAHKLKTNTEDSAVTALGDTTGGTRTITISQKDGTKTSVVLQDDQTSLNQIAQAINKQNGSVSASVQRVDDKYQLLLSSKKTGSDGEMMVQVDGDASLANILDTLHAGDSSQGDKMISVSSATDADLFVDGTEYRRSSNNISDIITGVTLNLKAKSETEEGEQLTLSPDTSHIKSSLQDFVKQYNSLLNLTTTASQYVKNDTSSLGNESVATQNSKNGALMGDSTLRGLVSQIRSTVNGVYGDPDSSYRSLADIGIKIDVSTGQMTLDEDTLDKAIADNPEQMAGMFVGRGDNSGLASRLGSIITDYIGDSKTSKNGIIKTATDSLSEQAKRVQVQIDTTQKLIDAQVERYRVQFQNLDKTMSSLNNTSNQLNSLLSSL